MSQNQLIHCISMNPPRLRKKIYIRKLSATGSAPVTVAINQISRETKRALLLRFVCSPIKWKWTVGRKRPFVPGPPNIHVCICEFARPHVCHAWALPCKQWELAYILFCTVCVLRVHFCRRVFVFCMYLVQFVPELRKYVKAYTNRCL